MTARAWLRRALRLGVAAVILGVMGCARNAPLDTLSPAGPVAREIKGLWDLVFPIAVAVFVLVEGLIVFSLFKFRARKGDTSDPKQTHGNTRLEIAWTIAPALILAFISVPTLLTIRAIAREPANPVRINVTAQQWWWRYEYPDQGVVTANELHIPAGRKIYLTLNSRDIIHSYWVPRLAGKQDVVPGRTNHLTIEADAPGRYAGQCVEYCGLSHANMRLVAVAQTQSDFDEWIAEQKAPSMVPVKGSLAAKGRAILEAQQCVGCHTIRGTKAAGTVGPDLTHFATRSKFAGYIYDRTDANLHAWLVDAPARKPGSKMPAGVATMGLTEDDITALIAYLDSLR